MQDVYSHLANTFQALNRDYRRVMTCVFSEWQNKPLLTITKDKVAKLHTRLGEEQGHAYANLAMRLLRALFNFAAGQYEDT